MPKILEHVKEQLITEAERQLREVGYAKTNIRSVAAACGIAVGTVYNYFPSKEMLVATCLAEDWRRVAEGLDNMRPASPEGRVLAIYTALTEFSARHATLFADPEAHTVFAGHFPARHPLLRGQVATWLLPITAAYPAHGQAFAADFAAEALITWTMAGTPFPTLYEMLKNTLKI